MKPGTFFGIGRKLLVAILLFSSVVTLALTALQLYLDYERDLGTIEVRMKEIGSGYHDSLARSLWSLDFDQIQVQLEGITRLPDVRSVTVRADAKEGLDKPWELTLGHPAADQGLTWNVPLVFEGKHELGTLTVNATLDGVYHRLREKVLTILVTQGVKTFLVSMFILFIVHWLVTRHLATMVHYLGIFDPHGKVVPLRLSRQAGRARDEFDSLVSAFNTMQEHLERSYADLREANEELERDIAARRSAEAEAAHLAYHDPLTGLPNRRQLQERLQHETTMAARLELHGALLFIDVDHFKNLNDALSHSIGDALLCDLARRLKRGVSDTDLVARLGDDEFAVLLLGLGQDAETAGRKALEIAEKLRESVGAPFDVGGQRLHVTASIGVSLFPADADGSESLIAHADTALHHAKAQGRNAVHFFQPAMQAAVRLQHELEYQLCQALIENQFSLVYQPLVDVSGRLVGAEALIRWQHPTKGLIPPAEFIPVAEGSSLIVDIGDWVLATAARQLHAWSVGGSLDNDFHLSVNISPRQFHQHDFCDRVKRICAASQVDPRRIVLEITEGVLVRDAEGAAAKMAELRKIGLSFFIDDFGIGYSSMSYLKRLPVDGLKIDQSFVREVATDANDSAIIEAIISMARSFGLAVVAEGVEVPEQYAHLRMRGCTWFQGYHFSRPLSAPEFKWCCLDLRSLLAPGRKPARPLPVAARDTDVQ